VVGAGRSGNTLLRLILDSHPELAIPPETDFIPELVAASAERDDPTEAFLRALRGHWRLRDLQVDVEAVTREIRRLQPFSPGDALRVVYLTYAAKFGKTRWGDKTPFYIGQMPLIAQVLPEARFIHVIRDGRAVWQSLRSVWFGPDTASEAARWWEEAVAAGRAGGSQVPHYLEIRFEDLVEEPAATLREVCAFIDLDWDPAILRFYERSSDRVAEVITDYVENGRLLATVQDRHRIHRLTASPPDARRATAWRRELPAEEVSAFEAVAGETLERLGYLD
jgi:hypothetical protein